MSDPGEPSEVRHPTTEEGEVNERSRPAELESDGGPPAGAFVQDDGRRRRRRPMSWIGRRIHVRVVGRKRTAPAAGEADLGSVLGLRDRPGTHPDGVAMGSSDRARSSNTAPTSCRSIAGRKLDQINAGNGRQGRGSIQVVVSVIRRELEMTIEAVDSSLEMVMSPPTWSMINCQLMQAGRDKAVVKKLSEADERVGSSVGTGEEKKKLVAGVKGQAPKNNDGGWDATMEPSSDFRVQLTPADLSASIRTRPIKGMTTTTTTSLPDW